MSKDLGRRLEELRTQNNLDISDLAKELSVSSHDIKYWEKGKASPDGEQLIKLSHIYKMPIDEILLNFDTESNFTYAEEKLQTQTVSSASSSTMQTTAVHSNNSAMKSTYNWHMFPYPVLVVFAYLILGLFFDRWHPTWLLFLTIPIYYTLVEVNKAKTFRKKANIFPYPIICVLIYLTLGFDYNMWHPMWIIFFTIPVYYMIVNGFRN